MTNWLIAARAVHFGGCLVCFGIFAFDRLVVSPAVVPGRSPIGEYWRSRVRRFSLTLLPIILASGIAWFAAVAAAMGGQPLQLEMLSAVWGQTQFGLIWKIRLIFWSAAVVIAFADYFPRRPGTQKILVTLQFLFSGALLGSLAWAGHGQETSRWHLAADVLHLLVAGFWPASLLPLAVVLARLRKSAEMADASLMAALVGRYSAWSLGAVALLVATGWVNTWFLVGSIRNLFGETYGRWLLAKLVLFVGAVAIGAVNLLRLKPRLVSGGHQSSKTAAQLQRNVHWEILLATIIIVIVAVLGILPPARP
jgi:copper resistance protein D